jgi:XapX domain-containing protein
LNTPAIQEGGCTNPRPPKSSPDVGQDLELIPVSGALLFSGVAFLAGVVCAVIGVVRPANADMGGIVGLIGMVLGLAAFVKAGTRTEKLVALCAAGIALGALIFAISGARGGS